jgi:tetratricopeptide (TPR) repeat protein
MKTALAAAMMIACAALAAAQPHDHAATQEQRPITLYPDLGTHNHPIRTRNADAQKYFNQGLTLTFAFNHEEAIRSFRKAAELDPAAAMPLWGIGYALGPNINNDVDLEREKAAYDATRRAVRLARNAPERERAYITALATRYSNDPKADLKALAVRFKDAMKALSAKYPDDLDAATLYAESLMDLHPWQLWALDGSPTEGTTEIVDVLERVLAADPNHVGANHFYIHAVEASLAPDRALPSAKRLETLVPGAGHLVHMPAHTYMRTGNYRGALEANVRAAAVDRKYIEETHAGGFYPAMYYTHNLDFLASAAMMTGEFAEAQKAADAVVENVSEILPDMAMLEPFAAKKLYVLLRFAKWDEVLALPAPEAKYQILSALHHFGRGLAYAGRGAVADAERERAAFQTAKAALPADTPWLYNTAGAVIAVADAVLDARIAGARGDNSAAIGFWQKAVAAEDRLSYDEPADWFFPTREGLGAALLRLERFDDARRVFREDLERNPGNGRSLFGVLQAIRGTNPNSNIALAAEGQFRTAWQYADVQLVLSDY